MKCFAAFNYIFTDISRTCTSSDTDLVCLSVATHLAVESPITSGCFLHAELPVLYTSNLVNKNDDLISE